MAFSNSFAPLWLIAIIVGIMVAVLMFDVVVLGRRPHVPSNRETGIALGVYVAAALIFGGFVWQVGGGQLAIEFYSGWITEYSLSVDNLFVFIIIMTKLGVPRQYQQFALLVGIVIALLLRGIFITIGAQAIEAWSWIFYLFGVFLIYTAIRLAADHFRKGGDEGEELPWVVRLIQRKLPFTQSWEGGTKLRIVDNGTKVFTPMMIVVIALGLTDLIFALDSIPAIFGLTQDPFLVLMANIFALMGLRQLYFLIGGLLQRLVYLSIGLSVLLAFIGVKLVLEAAHLNEVPFINNGEPISWAPEISTGASLAVIVGILVITTVASLLKNRYDARHRTTNSAVRDQGPTHD